MAIAVGPTTQFPAKGNIVKATPGNDEEVNLDDLCAIGLDRPILLDKYHFKDTTLLGEISTYWNSKLSATDVSLAEGLNYSPEFVANPSVFFKTAKPEQRKKLLAEYEAAGADKQTGSALGIGFPVDIPEKGGGAVVIRRSRQVFNIPIDANGNTPLRSNLSLTQIPIIQFLDTPITGAKDLKRYNPPVVNPARLLESTEFILEVVDSGLENADVLGFDIGVQARYAAFSGSLDFAYDDAYFADRRNYRLYLIIRQSFGWRYMPSDEIEKNLTDDFRRARDASLIDDQINLAGPPSDPNGFGEYYAVADHRTRSLIFEINVSTFKEEDRTSFGGRVKAAYDGVGSSFSLNAGVNRLLEQNIEVAEVKIDATQIGGPLELDLDGDGEEDTTVQAEITRLADQALNGQPTDGGALVRLVEAWAEAGNRDTTAVSTDYLYVPVKALAPVPQNPLDKTAKLRAWFKRLTECNLAVERAKLLTSIANRPLAPGLQCEVNNIFLRQEYDYLATQPPFTPPTYYGAKTYLEYAQNQYCDTIDLYQDLLDVGVDIIAESIDRPVKFNPNDAFWRVPDFVANTIDVNGGFISIDDPNLQGVSCDPSDPSEYCNQCLQGKYQFSFENINPSGQSRYVFLYRFNPDSAAIGGNPVCEGTGDNGVVISKPQQIDEYSLTVNRQGGGSGCGFCWGNWNQFYSQSGAGLALGLLDTKTGQVVSAISPSRAGTVSLGRAAREQLSVEGRRVPVLP